MEDMMMMTTTISSPDNPSNESISSQEPITTSTFPTWKLYENPFYNPHQYHHHNHQCQSIKHKSIHHLHLPLSTRKIAASFWDLTFFKPIMETELDIARAQIDELKAELDFERKARKKTESMNKRLAKQLSEERIAREAMERVCEELAREISFEKSEIDRMKRDLDEERQMMRMAEVIREERVQMKLTEAKILFEEKLLELEQSKIIKTDDNNQQVRPPVALKSTENLSGKYARLVLNEKFIDENSNRVDLRENLGSVISMAIQRRGSSVSEPENPHIKRGIKGFVEFPRVVRAMGSKGRHWDWGTKLECQKAQLRILLKQKSPIRANNLIIS